MHNTYTNKKISLLSALCLSLGLVTACAAPTNIEPENALDASKISTESEPSKQPSEPKTTPEPKVSQDEEPKSEENTQDAEKPEITEIDISQIPTHMETGQKAIELKARLLLSDGSQSKGVSYSIEDDGILRKEGNFITPLSAGETTLTVRATGKSSIKEVINIVVSGESATNTPSSIPNLPVPTKTAQPTSGTKDTELLNSYYLDNYQVGMSWEYQVSLGAIAPGVSMGKPYPETIELGWGLKLENITQDGEGNLPKVFDLMDLHEDMGRWRLEVTNVGDNNVTIRSEYISYWPPIPSQAIKEVTYTPDTIGQLYTGVVQTTPPENRKLEIKKQNVSKKAYFYPLPSTQFTAVEFNSDYLEGEMPVSDGLHYEERVLLWMNKEVGLIDKIIHLDAFREGYLSVDTGLHLSLESFSKG